jgi:uncharacterized protein YfbU (UPF0304 family)
LSEDQSEFFLEPELLRRIDGWRALQSSKPTRAQAVSELIGAGLRDQENQGLSMGEKLILSILCDVGRKVGSEGMIDPDFLEAAIKGGHSWAIEWQHPSLSHGHTNSQNTAEFVIRVLSMWRLVEDSFAKLSEQEKDLVRQEAGLSGVPSYPGWDSEQEANYKSTARFMTERMNLFPMFEGRSAIDSGQPVLERYKLMLNRLAEFGKKSSDQALSAGELVRLLRAN